jgi:tetratricopeptide (TPR) repeat protein
LGQLGALFQQRLLEGIKNKQPPETLLHYYTEAQELFEQSLTIMPKTDINNLAVLHNQLGNLYNLLDDTVTRALDHYQRSIRYYDQLGDVFTAGMVRANTAGALLQAGRGADARSYALAALTNLRQFGSRAAVQVASTERLLAHIDDELATKR